MKIQPLRICRENLPYRKRTPTGEIAQIQTAEIAKILGEIPQKIAPLDPHYLQNFSPANGKESTCLLASILNVFYRIGILSARDLIPENEEKIAGKICPPVRHGEFIYRSFTDFTKYCRENSDLKFTPTNSLATVLREITAGAAVLILDDSAHSKIITGYEIHSRKKIDQNLQTARENPTEIFLEINDPSGGLQNRGKIAGRPEKLKLEDFLRKIIGESGVNIHKIRVETTEQISQKSPIVKIRAVRESGSPHFLVPPENENRFRALLSSPQNSKFESMFFCVRQSQSLQKEI
jgi:hypothetical protein